MVGGAALTAQGLVALFDGLGEGVAVLGSDSRFQYVNQVAAETLGRTAEQLVGRNVWTEFPQGVGHPLHVACERVMRIQKATTVEEFYPLLDRWFEVRILPRGNSLVIMAADITSRKRAHAELREQAWLMAEAEKIGRFGVWTWEVESGRVRWSAELHRIYGLGPAEFGGTIEAFTEHLHPDDRARVWSHIQHTLDTHEPFIFQERITRADLSVRTLLSQGCAIVGPAGKVSRLVGTCHDVTDHSDVQRALGHSERRMRAILDHSPSLIGVKDLDGRYLLTNAATGRLLKLDQEELVGRECTELFPAIAEQLRSNDRRAAAEMEPVFDEAVLDVNGEPRTFVTVTFALPDDSEQAVETCTIATDVTERRERESERRERIAWHGRLASAVEGGRMLVFAQPIMNLTTSEVERHELLVRMQEGEPPEVLQPAAFLPEAERHGLIQILDVWMVRQALELAAHFPPAVNMSAVTLCDEQARLQVLSLLTASPEAASRIVFEITETAAAEHLDAAVSFAASITELGCGLALDDFGTGFGSFTYLRRLPLRYLKIDMSFILDLFNSADDQRVVRSILSIAEQFGLVSIAEGVENEETLELLRKLGAVCVQGFHLGHPQPVWAPPS